GLTQADEEVGRPGRSVWSTILGSVEGRIGVAGAIIIALIVIVGPFVAPYPPDELQTGPPLTGPSRAHLLGTDSLGRDVLSRFLNGGTFVVLVPLCAVVIAFIVGGGLGAAAAYRGGSVDAFVSRLFDLFLALPPLLIALVILAGVGT